MLIINTQVLEVLAALAEGQKLLRLVLEDLALLQVESFLSVTPSLEHDPFARLHSTSSSSYTDAIQVP